MNSGQRTMGSAVGNGRGVLDEEVPVGYKRTEVGVIPEDWECWRLGDLTTRVGSGVTPSGGERVYVTEGRPFLRSQNVVWGVLDLADLAFITDEIHASFAASEIEEGDVLLNITGASIGRSAVADITVARGNVNQHVCEIRTDLKKLDPHFLNSYLLSAAGQKQIDSFQAGGNRQGLNYSQIRSFLIPRPPLSEQRAIAAALSDVNGLLAVLEALIAKKRAIKQATMQQLLAGKTRLPGFSGTWETKRLGNVLTVRHGRSQRYITGPDGKYPILASGGEIGRTDVSLYDKPSVLIGRKGTIDNPQYVSSPFWTVDTLFYTEIADGMSAKFLYYKFCMIPWRSYNEASGVPSLNSRTIENIEVNLPKSDEQRAIAAVLSDMDAEIAALERRWDKIRTVKQGMMQQLLTGRVRLLKPDLDRTGS